VLPPGNWQGVGVSLDFGGGVMGFVMRRRALIGLAIVGAALALSGCAGPCGWIWDDWFYPPKTCHQQHIGQ
jgi:hypothetical protein